MRAIKYKYALALDMTILCEWGIDSAIEQAKEISDELGISVNLRNPSNGKEFVLNSNTDDDEIKEALGL